MCIQTLLWELEECNDLDVVYGVLMVVNINPRGI